MLCAKVYLLRDRGRVGTFGLPEPFHELKSWILKTNGRRAKQNNFE